MFPVLSSTFGPLSPSALIFPAILLLATFVCFWFASRANSLVLPLAAVIILFSQPDFKELRYMRQVGAPIDWWSTILQIIAGVLSAASIVLWLFRRFRSRPK